MPKARTAYLLLALYGKGHTLTLLTPAPPTCSDTDALTPAENSILVRRRDTAAEGRSAIPAWIGPPPNPAALAAPVGLQTADGLTASSS